MILLTIAQRRAQYRVLGRADGGDDGLGRAPRRLAAFRDLDPIGSDVDNRR